MEGMIRYALRKPITIYVIIGMIGFFSFLTFRTMKIDIFPSLGLPVVYVAQPYGGLSPEQMEGFITSYYEYHFLYITGVKRVESRSIQGASLIKVEFHEGTEMSQAMAEVVGYVNRSRAFMPPGTVPPFITRFDTGSVPVGQLVFSSKTRSLGEISDLALFRVRPMFASLPGVSAPPPFGGNQKTVIINLDPAALRNYNFSPEEISQKILDFNLISPAGNIRIDDKNYLTPQNTSIETLDDLKNIPLRIGQGASVYLKDLANVQLGMDITTGYALVNGDRSVYIPVTKRADASTWDVVQNVKAALPVMRKEIPSDIEVSYEFDQSGYVVQALKTVAIEGLLGAVLTGLMVLLFLRDRQGALIVVLTIPIALLTSMIFLNLFGQTLNIMTLGGLALSIGILVDEATVTIENIHRHFEMGKAKSIAVWEACREIIAPKLLILLSILTVFAPAFFMTGVPKGMFLPLSLAVAFSMTASFLLSMTFVPILAIQIMNPNGHNQHDKHAKEPDKNRNNLFFDKLFQKYQNTSEAFLQRPGKIILVFLSVSFFLIGISLFAIKKEIFPSIDSGQTVVRLLLPTGSRLERTEAQTKRLLVLAESILGKGGMEISSAYVGSIPSSYPVNLIHLWTSGPHESLMRLKFKKENRIPVAEFQEKLRQRFAKEYPDSRLSFEPGDLVDQIMNMGATNPIEIHLEGKDLRESSRYAKKIVTLLEKHPKLRDVQIATPMDYPTIKIQTDRIRTGQLGANLNEVSHAIVASTSSTRFTKPNYWLDSKSGTAYQVQIEYPQYKMNSISELESIPIKSSSNGKIYLRDLASTQFLETPGEFHRVNQKRIVRITANLYNLDLGSGIQIVTDKLKALGKLPEGIKVQLKGQKEILETTTLELQTGIGIAVIVVFFLLSASFQSFRVSLVTISIIPFVLSGSLILLVLTGHSLNIQSFLGSIMSIGVSVANSILYVSHAEFLRKENKTSSEEKSDREDLGKWIGFEAGKTRFRPIVMTNFAMVAGMLPMALGLGEGSDSVAPLGVAVVGGLVFSLFATLFFLPNVYSLFVGNRMYTEKSLDPNPNSEGNTK